MPRTFKVTAHTVDEMRTTVLEYYATRVPADERSDAALERIRTADGFNIAMMFGHVDAVLRQDRIAAALTRRVRSAWWAAALYLAGGAIYGIRATFLSPEEHPVDGVLSVVLFVVLVAACCASLYATARVKGRKS